MALRLSQVDVRNALADSSSTSSSTTTTIFGNSGVYAEVVSDEDTGDSYLAVIAY